MLTHERLLTALHYNDEIGVMTWRIPRRGHAAGRRAGSKNVHGYRVIRLDGELYPEHRLAYFYKIGKWPEHEVDHIDRIRDNNRWANLRAATHSQNMRNFPAYGMHPVKGVKLQKGRWYARIRVDGRLKGLGGFATMDEAHAAYMAKARELSGEFASAA